MTKTQNTNLAADGSHLISWAVENFPHNTSFGDEVALPVSGKIIAAMRKAAK